MAIPDPAPLPTIVSPADWQAAHEQLLAKEKAATHARDALAAERRRQPMYRLDKDYWFDGPSGAAGIFAKVHLRDLFAGRRQLLLYHFMFAPNASGWPDAGCPGCSMFVDQIGHPAHFHARDVSIALVSLAPIDKIEAYRKRMDWELPWFSSAKSSFNVDLGVTLPDAEHHGLSVLLRDGDKIYRTYFTAQRGCEALGSVWSFLDLTPYGRQEKWEDSPAGWPQADPYQWWRRHDEY
jgi:predicted dithiol-disulfide oxidoreductase (DUF899 family)